MIRFKKEVGGRGGRDIDYEYEYTMNERRNYRKSLLYIYECDG